MNGADCTVEELLLSLRLFEVWSKSSERSAGRWVEVARECIRQMRYAHAQWPEDAYPDSGSEAIAPDDWKP